VLTETKSGEVDTDGGEEEVDSSDEVSEGLVIDDSLERPTERREEEMEEREREGKRISFRS